MGLKCLKLLACVPSGRHQIVWLLGSKMPLLWSISLTVLLCFRHGSWAQGGNQVLGLGDLKLVIDSWKEILELVHRKGGIQREIPDLLLLKCQILSGSCPYLSISVFF